MGQLRHEQGLPFRPLYQRPKMRHALPYDAPVPMVPSRAVTAGLWLGVAGVLLILALVLGLYRDELNGLVFVPAGMSLIGLPVSVAAAIRRRMRVSAFQFAMGTLLNGLILAATARLFEGAVAGTGPRGSRPLFPSSCIRPPEATAS